MTNPAYNPFRGYRPHEKQRELHSRKERFICLLAARRSGKTYGISREFLKRVLTDYTNKCVGAGRWVDAGPQLWKRVGKQVSPFLLYWIIAPTYSLTEELRHELQSLLGFVEEGGLITKQVGNIYWLKGGIRIDFKSADKPHLLVSKGVDGVILEEVCRMDETVWTEHMLPTLLDSHAWLLAISSPRGRDWVWRNLYCKGNREEAELLATEENVAINSVLDDNFFSTSWKTTDNCSIPDVKKRVEALRKLMPDALFKRSFESTFDAFVGQCFEELTEDAHIQRNFVPNAFSSVWCGIDWGYRHNAAIVVWGLLQNTKMYVEIETYSAPKMLVDSDDSWRLKIPDCMTVATKQLQEKWGFRVIYAGHENPHARRAFEYRGFDIRIAYTNKSAGLQWFQTKIHGGNIKFCSGETYREFAGIHYPESRAKVTHTDKNSELWADVKDDRFAASRYALSEAIQSFERQMRRDVFGMIRN